MFNFLLFFFFYFLCFFFFFFFQAEDGIRDHCVTGVQTCALPICAIVRFNASKAALLGLNRTMALELAQYGIRVNGVSPGFTHTDMTEKAVGPKLMEYLNGSFARVPMRRLVKPSEVAAAFAFLASDDASAITGQNLVVDCGLTANWYILETLPS